MNISSNRNGNGNRNWYVGMGENGNEKRIPAHVYHKLRCYDHVMRQPQDSVENSVMTGLVDGV